MEPNPGQTEYWVVRLDSSMGGMHRTKSAGPFDTLKEAKERSSRLFTEHRANRGHPAVSFKVLTGDEIEAYRSNGVDIY